MYTQMKFTDNERKENIEFSELLNDKEIFVSMYRTGSSDIHCTPFSEKEMRELRRHLTIQIRKIKK